MAASLRSKDHEIIGSPSKLPENVLPNKEDVLKRLLLSKEVILANSPGDKAKPKVEKFAQVVVAELIMIWDKFSIPTVTHRAILNALCALWRKATSEWVKNDSKKAEAEAEKLQLFDICSCKCKRILCKDARCTVEECEELHFTCSCVADKKVPVRELSFLFDQRESRKMVMGGLDKKVTGTLKRAEKRNAAFELQEEKEEKRV
jgi:hypothetical protein